MADLVSAPASRTKSQYNHGGQIYLAQAAAKMKPGQAVMANDASEASRVATILRAFTGKTFRSYRAEDGRVYLTLQSD